MESLTFDVIIIGAGSAGCAASYALKGSEHKVLLVDNNKMLGGTSTNAWVNCFAATPDCPFLRDIFKKLVMQGSAMFVDRSYVKLIERPTDVPWNEFYKRSLLHQSYLKDRVEELSICVNVEDLANVYEEDLQKGNITIWKESSFVGVVECNSGVVSSIEINHNGEKFLCKANIFIDASGDDVLYRSALKLPIEGEDFYIGVDKNDRYYLSHGFIEENGMTHNNTMILNAPTLMYKIEKGKETHITRKLFGEDGLVYKSPNGNIYVNSVCLLSGGDEAFNVIKKGVGWVYDVISPRSIFHWNTIRGSKLQKFQDWDLTNKRFVTNAPMLGVRETYRANCERMLNENDLSVPFVKKIFPQNEIFDEIIAIGNHNVDIHRNEPNKLKIPVFPYGVPFGVLVPKKLSNVFIASRGSGFTHIAAGSFRLNKDMAQLGWAAGNAAKYLCDNKVSNTKEVDVKIVKGNRYMDFYNTCRLVESVLLRQ